MAIVLEEADESAFWLTPFRGRPDPGNKTECATCWGQWTRRNLKCVTSHRKEERLIDGQGAHNLPFKLVGTFNQQSKINNQQ